MLKFSYEGLHTVISGGQHGADLAGLTTARRFCLKTGGMAPKGFRTQYGPDPELANFGLIESISELYPPRTKYNVENSDATIILSQEMTSAGTALTIKLCILAQKPYHLVHLNEQLEEQFYLAAADFIEHNRVGVLNVAGNHERDGTKGRSGTIFTLASVALMAIFTQLRKRDLLLLDA